MSNNNKCHIVHYDAIRTIRINPMQRDVVQNRIKYKNATQYRTNDYNIMKHHTLQYVQYDMSHGVIHYDMKYSASYSVLPDSAT